MREGTISGHAAPSDPVPSLAQRAPDEARERPAHGRGGPSLPLGPPTEGGTRAEGGRDPACIVISGQKLSTPVMVGSGPECDPGPWLPRKAACPKCGHSVTLYHSGCGHVLCPRCSKRWARRGGERAGARVYGAFLAYVSKFKPRHITFELDWKEGTPLSWDAVKAHAEKVIGCTGGLLVVHPWRIRPHIEREWENLRDQKQTDLNRYDWVKRHYGMGGFDWSPHVHALAYGKFAEVRSGSEIFLYRNIRKLQSLRMTEGVTTYLLSHTFAPTGKESVYRYFGICSTQRLKPEFTTCISEPMICEHCGSKMVEEGTNNLYLKHHYLALGWHSITPSRSRGARGAPPPHAPRVETKRPDPFKKWAPA